MNACGKFNWIFDVFKLRKNEREILAPHLSGHISIFAPKPVPARGKLIFNALALSLGPIFMF